MSGDEVVEVAEREVRRAGEEPPDIPSESALEDLLPNLLEGVDEVATGYLVRASLPSEDPERAGERLVDALERKVTVLGSTLTAGVDPADPQVDVLIQCEYTASQIASALGGVTPVRGAVVVEVTDVCERLLESPDEEADVADANDVFNELQQQVTELDYDQVVDELEGVSFPGGPDADEEVDLEDEADVDLGSDGDAGGDVELEDVALDDAALNGDSGDDSDADAGDGVDAKELFGEGEAATHGQGSTAAMGGADEQRIEEAIKSVEESADDESDGEEATDHGSAGEDVTADAEANDATTNAGPDDDVTADAGMADGTGATDDGTSDGAGTADGEAPTGPDVPEVDAGSSDGEDAPPAPDRAGSDGAGGTPDQSPAAEATTAAEASAAGGSKRAGSAPPAESASDGGSAATAPGSAADVDRLVDDLVTALESGAVGPDRRQGLREALGVESTHSLDVRLEYLQKRVDNLAAYTDAWEAFLAEEGTGNQFIEEIDDEIEALRARVETLESGGAAGGTAASDARIEDLADRVDALEDEHGRRLDEVEETLGSLRRSVEALGNWRDRVNDLLGDRL